MLPARRGTRPMMDFIVVVLPAPLRPSSVTTSPSATSKSTPCSTWLSPYQAFSPAIFSAELSGIRGPQIGGDHFGVLRHGGVVALGQHAAPGQHRDPVAESLHDGQVVLDHQDRPPGAD